MPAPEGSGAEPKSWEQNAKGHLVSAYEVEARGSIFILPFCNMEVKMQKATGVGVHSSHAVEGPAFGHGALPEVTEAQYALVWCALSCRQWTQRGGGITTTKKSEEEKLSKGNLPQEQPAYETYILYKTGWKDLARERRCTENPPPHKSSIVRKYQSRNFCKQLCI